MQKGPDRGPFAYRRRRCGSGGGNFARVGIDDLGGLVLLRPGDAAATGGLLETIAVSGTVKANLGALSDLVRMIADADIFSSCSAYCADCLTGRAPYCGF